MYGETVAAIVRVWDNSDTYGHGFLIVPISLYLVWDARERLGAILIRPAVWGLPLLALASGLWFAAHVIDVQIGKQLSLFLLLVLALWTMLGASASRILMFPVGYLLFAIPFWSFVIPALQTQTALSSAWILKQVGVPVFLDGFYLSIPSGKFVVADVCAGLRYLMATMSIAALFAYLNYRSVLRGSIFFAFAICWAIFFNWVRVVAIVYIGHATEMQHPLVHSHNWFGWGLFAAALIPLFFIGHWGMRFDNPTPRVGDRVSGVPMESSSSVAQIVAVGIACVMIAGSGQAAALWMENLALEALNGPPLEEPPILAGWENDSGPQKDAWHPKFIGASDSRLTYYRDGPVTAGFYVARYFRQHQGAELISELNTPYDKEKWKVARRGEHTVASPDVDLNVNELLLRGPRGQTRLMWYWYQVAGVATHTQGLAKLLQLQGLVTNNPQAAVLAITTENFSDMEKGRQTLERFTRTLLAKLPAYLEVK